MTEHGMKMPFVVTRMGIVQTSWGVLPPLINLKQHDDHKFINKMTAMKCSSTRSSSGED